MSHSVSESLPRKESQSEISRSGDGSHNNHKYALNSASFFAIHFNDLSQVAAFKPRQACFCLGSLSLGENFFLFDMMQTSKTELEYRSHEVHNMSSSILYSWQLHAFASRTVFFYHTALLGAQCNPEQAKHYFATLRKGALWSRSACKQKHAIPRQAEDMTLRRPDAHCTGIVHKLNDRATSQGHPADRILCLACRYMTRLRLPALESYTNQTRVRTQSRLSLVRAAHCQI